MPIIHFMSFSLHINCFQLQKISNDGGSQLITKRKIICNILKQILLSFNNDFTILTINTQNFNTRIIPIVVNFNIMIDFVYGVFVNFISTFIINLSFYQTMHFTLTANYISKMIALELRPKNMTPSNVKPNYNTFKKTVVSTTTLNI